MEFMQEAIKEGCDGVEHGDGGPFGAVIVKDGQVIATGHNKVLIDKDPTAHAETVAIRNAGKKLDSFDLSGCILYTSCYPCPMCLAAALWATIDAVYYATSLEESATFGFNASNIYEVVKNHENQTIYKIERFEIDDKMKPFETWENKTDKINPPCLTSP